MEGGVEANYDDLVAPTGFAPASPRRRRHAARGAMLSARRRAARPGPLTVVSEAEYYGATAEDGASSGTPAA
jgi:hypothetical protein